jgi:heme exporter protein B
MHPFQVLLFYDIKSECRSLNLVVLSAFLSLLLTLLIGAGVALSALRPEEITHLAPLFYWLVVLIVATLVLDRSMDKELELGALDTLRTCGVSLSMLYLSRVTGSFFLTSFIHIISSSLLVLMVGLPPPPSLFSFSLLSSLVLLGYSCLSTLVVPLTARSGFKGSLFSLVLIPLLFPLFFSGINVSYKMFQQGSVPWDSAAVSLLGALVVVYGALGINLYEFALEE